MMDHRSLSSSQLVLHSYRCRRTSIIVGKEVSTAVQVSGSASRLSSILGTYSSIDSLSTRPDTSYPNDKFPVENFPTGGNDNTFNPTPVDIFTRNAVPNDNTRNDVTIDDVALRSASERHQNAVKGITNLLKLIDQARANKKQAERDVQTLTQAHNLSVNKWLEKTGIIGCDTDISHITASIEKLKIVA